MLLIALCDFAYAAKVYKWTGANGKTHYGDKPAGSASKEKTILKTNKAPTVREAPTSDEAQTNSGAGEYAAFLPSIKRIKVSCNGSGGG